MPAKWIAREKRGMGRVFYLSIGRNDGEDGDELERSIRLFITPYLQTNSINKTKNNIQANRACVSMTNTWFPL